MLEKLSLNSGIIRGYKASGVITKEDYAVISGDLDGLIKKENEVCLLLDMEAFEGEEFKAWGAGLRFGHSLVNRFRKWPLLAIRSGRSGWPRWPILSMPAR